MPSTPSPFLEQCFQQGLREGEGRGHMPGGSRGSVPLFYRRNQNNTVKHSRPHPPAQSQRHLSKQKKNAPGRRAWMHHNLLPTRTVQRVIVQEAIGVHFLQREGESEVTQSCPTLYDPMDCSPPGSSVHGTLQASILEWVAISCNLSVYFRGWGKWSGLRTEPGPQKH